LLAALREVAHRGSVALTAERAHRDDPRCHGGIRNEHNSGMSARRLEFAMGWEQSRGLLVLVAEQRNIDKVCCLGKIDVCRTASAGVVEHVVDDEPVVIWQRDGQTLIGDLGSNP
jgi:hypothetical protein